MQNYTVRKHKANVTKISLFFHRARSYLNGHTENCQGRRVWPRSAAK